MRIPLIRKRGDDTPPAWWEWIFAPFLCLLFLVLALLAAGMTILAMPFFVFAIWRRERRFERYVRERGRFIPWLELKPRLLSGEGTLIVEQAQKDGYRIWWTHEDVLKIAPVQPLPEEELDFFRTPKVHPFVTWCFEQFLSPETGRAFLTKPRLNGPAGFFEHAYFAKKFPTLQIVMTVKVM